MILELQQKEVKMTILDAYRLQELLDANKIKQAQYLLKKYYTKEDVVSDVIYIPAIDYKILVDDNLTIILSESTK